MHLLDLSIHKRIENSLKKWGGGGDWVGPEVKGEKDREKRGRMSAAYRREGR